MSKLTFHKNEVVIFKGTNHAPVQKVVILETLDSFHLPYLIESTWLDGKVHRHWVEAAMLERGSKIASS